MKRSLSLIFTLSILSFIISCNCSDDDNSGKSCKTKDSHQEINTDNNNFYDDVESHSFELDEILVEGEISNPGKLDLCSLPTHSVIVKEAVLSGDSNVFAGAYRYDGYSLFDILTDKVLDKKNAAEFGPIIDLYVEISNDKGEKAIISWGEIFYPVHLHEILIASSVRRIVPSKTNELWPLPGDYKLVVAGDLLTERNIMNPTKITVKSYARSYVTVKGMKPMFSPDIQLFMGEKPIGVLDQAPAGAKQIDYESVFYGRGRGIHSTSPFHGFLLKDILAQHFPLSSKNIQEGFFTIAAKDGYRCVFTYSELMNRNDQSEVLLIYQEGKHDGGAFRLFPACDFFSDRAIKSVSEIRFNIE